MSFVCWHAVEDPNNQEDERMMEATEEKDRSEELKPCPFCGEDYVSQVFNGSDQYVSSFWVMCGNCDAEGPVADTEDGAVEKWNNRCEYEPGIPII